ncbi:MAG TPA: ATP-binding cassette domain-containing protein [Alcaligenes sp.]|nr:ATP-binding cassette domain-containing protein [Alcaligenes faecalis]HRL20306.1 ATP-binding cassette domain-containing protein [Alcaligenes sp.]
MFQLEKAGMHLSGKTLLHSTTVRIESAGVYGLVGHNGSGKSTLLKILAGQLQPSSGVALFKDIPISQWKPTRYARQVAYLPQQLPPSEHLSTQELIGCGRYPWLGLLGRAGAQDRAQVERAMALTQTSAYRDQCVDTLSGGERQRVWLAMLLAQQSRFLLLDEPLSALDIAHQIDVLELIRRLSVELGICIVLVLHDINLAARYCDQLIALRAGRIVFSGTATDLMNAPQLKAIYGVEMSLIRHPVLDVPVALVN